jgi:hypothetical protein
MSRFRILRVDHFDPVSVGKKNRFMFAIYGIIPTLFILSFNIGEFTGMSYRVRLLISIPLLAMIYFFVLKKMRSTINDLKTIGEIEITQTSIKKRIGDSLVHYDFEQINEIQLIKHIPATRIKESRSRYFSYIFKITLRNKSEESLVVSDRSVDHNQKISLAETIKTLKKIAPFKVTLEL